jgi:GT2 family glycosyltransferase
VVGNGSPVPDLPEGVRTVELPENLGIPGGRNVGIEAFGPAGGDVDILMFLDDDGLLGHQDTAELCRSAFAADPELGIISFRIADPDTGLTQRRHVPRPGTTTRCAAPGSPPSSAAPTPSAPRSSPRWA